ncbi:fasciclin-like arabinogalactan 1, partial [Olea europaea subsp. europaea]
AYNKNAASPRHCCGGHCSIFSTTTNAHNITSILAKFSEFSTFNHYLTETHLAEDINNQKTITVCAVDNVGMSDLIAKHLPFSGIKNVLSLHALLDYFNAKKLHQITNGTATTSSLKLSLLVLQKIHMRMLLMVD